MGSSQLCQREKYWNAIILGFASFLLGNFLSIEYEILIFWFMQISLLLAPANVADCVWFESFKKTDEVWHFWCNDMGRKPLQFAFMLSKMSTVDVCADWIGRTFLKRSHLALKLKWKFANILFEQFSFSQVNHPICQLTFYFILFYHFN